MNGLWKLSRREFLQKTGVASGGLVFAMTLGAPRGAVGSVAGSVAPNVYVNIRDDDIVEIYCHRSEMGQGIRTSLPQVIADELEADWDRIELVQALGDAKYGDQNTDGSTSIRKQFDLLRLAGASAREMLIMAAAQEWGVPAGELVARNHAVHHEASGRSAAYGDLVASAAELEVPDDVKFKDPAEYRYIGKPVDLIDGIPMTTGTAMYGTDTVLPGMLYACPACCMRPSSVARYSAESLNGLTTPKLGKLPASRR
jgi:isoquinoline 1-oxidoreductase beta subunit